MSFPGSQIFGKGQFDFRGKFEFPGKLTFFGNITKSVYAVIYFMGNKNYTKNVTSWENLNFWKKLDFKVNLDFWEMSLNQFDNGLARYTA